MSSTHAASHRAFGIRRPSLTPRPNENQKKLQTKKKYAIPKQFKKLRTTREGHSSISHARTGVWRGPSFGALCLFRARFRVARERHHHVTNCSTCRLVGTTRLLQTCRKPLENKAQTPPKLPRAGVFSRISYTGDRLCNFLLALCRSCVIL